MYIKAPREVVCYTVVFSVVMQRSSPLTAAENRTTFLSLCACGLIKNQSCIRNLTVHELQGARSKHASHFLTIQSIVAKILWALCLQATKSLFAEKFVSGCAHCVVVHVR